LCVRPGEVGCLFYISPIKRDADKGFGFITPEDGGKDLFVHHSEIQSGGGYATLNDGQAVEYELGEGQKGPCANKVIPL